MKTYIGIIIAALVTIISDILSRYIGINIMGFSRSPISPIMVSLVTGFLLSNLYNKVKDFNSGFLICIDYFLKIGIIFLGIRLSLFQILQHSFSAFVLILPGIIISLSLVFLLSDRFKLSKSLASLIAVGTSICGVSAIVALGPSINAKKEEITFAVANITLFGLASMFIYPFLSNYLFNSDLRMIGLFLGSSIHDTAQVIGAAKMHQDIYLNDIVLNLSMVVKLLRNSLMIFVIPALIIYNSTEREYKKISFNKIIKLFPAFIIGFIVFGLFRTLGDYIFISPTNHNVVMSEYWITIIGTIQYSGNYLIAISMSAIGLNTNYNLIKNIGFSPLIFSFIVASTVGLSSYLMIIFII